MLLWHMGVGSALVYLTLGRRRIDYRFILIGAIAPDPIDGLLGLAGVGHGGRALAHGLLAVLVVAVIVIVAARGERRVAAFGLAVGWLTHLVADGMWAAPRTFYWPAFGTAFESAPAEPYAWGLFTAPGAHLSTWLAELAGAALLAWFYVAFRLGEDGRLRTFLGDGHLRP